MRYESVIPQRENVILSAAKDLQFGDVRQRTTSRGLSCRDDYHTQVVGNSERHRRPYEFNREYEALLTGAGLRVTGTTPDATYVEIVELPSHPFFLGWQFHPELKSERLKPHPLFKAFIEAGMLVE